MDKNTFAPRPPMGWNSYDYYDTAVTEADIRANADFMAKNLKQFGWEYVVVDIAWYSNDAGKQRKKFQYIPFGDTSIDEYGRFIPSVRRFPSSADGAGFRPLADYIHSLGLKFGIHIMRGIPRTAAERHLPVLGSSVTAAEIADPSCICPWNPDMYGVRDNADGQKYYDSIIGMYASWGVDFIKCDDICDSKLYPTDSFPGYSEQKMIAKAIQNAGRQIVFSLSPGPAHIDRAWEYCRDANMWRITDDLWDNWKDLLNMFHRCQLWQDNVKTGCYPDCDMLPFGQIGYGFGEERHTRLTEEEQRTMMTLWCMFRSPLMLGCELTKLDPATLALITDKELLHMQMGNCRGEQLERTEDYSIWCSTDLDNGERKLAAFNLSDKEMEISCEGRSVTVPSHGVRFIR